RKVKWRDGKNRAEREAPHQAPAPGGGLQSVERKVLTVNPQALLGRDLEGVDGALHFNTRRPDGLACFLADGAGEFLAARTDALGDFAEDGSALVRRHLARDRKRPHG